MDLTGTVSSGLGRAHVFMAQPHLGSVQDHPRQHGMASTLNINIDDAMFSHYTLRQKAGIDTLDAPQEDRDKAKTHDVDAYERIRIRGFLRDGVSFGGASALKASFITGNTRLNAPSSFPT